MDDKKEHRRHVRIIRKHPYVSRGVLLPLRALQLQEGKWVIYPKRRTNSETIIV